MNNPFDELTDALNQARALQRAVDAQSNAMAKLMIGNLRSVAPYNLCRLKQELRYFNMHTGKWK